MSKKNVFTTGEVAKICGVAPRTVSKWFDSGRLRGFRVPGSQDRRIPLEHLLRFLNEHGMKIPPGLTGMEIVKIKRHHPHACPPTKNGPLEAGWDLYCCEGVVIKPGEQVMVPTGISMAMPENWYGQLQSRSGLSANHRISVRAGVIDSTYRGQIQVILVNEGQCEFHLARGDRVAQMIFHEVLPAFMQTCVTLPDSSRGENGFGSSGS